MTSKANRQSDIRTISLDQALLSAERILVIEAPAVMEMLTPQPGKQSVIVTHKRMLNAAMMGNINPDAVVSPLIAPDWDIVELATTLKALQFRGTLFALTQPLPRAELVIREVVAVCPDIKVKLVEFA